MHGRRAWFIQRLLSAYCMQSITMVLKVHGGGDDDTQYPNSSPTHGAYSPVRQKDKISETGRWSLRNVVRKSVRIRRSV